MEKQLQIKYLKDISIFLKIIFFSYINIFILSSCSVKNDENKTIQINNDSKDLVLEEFVKIYPVLENYDWEIITRYNYDDEKYLEITSEINDTTILVALQKEIFKEDYRNTYCFSMKRFVINYSSNDYIHELRLHEGKDTLYHFYYNVPYEEDSKIFIKGEYNYMFTHYLLDSLQRIYYLENKDSLTLIKGNNLPELPRISPH